VEDIALLSSIPYHGADQSEGNLVKPPLRPKTDHAAEMAQFLKAHGELARVLLEILRDGAIPITQKGPVIAAARYTAEENDLIPDSVPVFGHIDDLYIAAIALEETLPVLGERGTDLGERKLADGDRLGGRLTAMQGRFHGFWQYCKKAAEPFIKRNLEHYKAHPQQLPGLCAQFEKEVAKIEQACAKEIRLDPKDVERFIAQFRRMVVDE
jgi:uncharacterized membrane protein YkvA (DUF1232 family)